MPILKMLGRHSPSAIANTLAYISRDAEDGSYYLHNLRSDYHDQQAIVEELLENETYRKVTANRLYCFHSIISLSDQDQEKVTPEILEAIAQKYFELRDDVLAVAVPHLDTDSPHIHILESSTRYRENKSSGLRKQEMQQLKMELEGFIQEQFPQLEHSQIAHGKGREYLSEPEYQLQKREGKSEKEHLKALVKEAYARAISKQEFLEALLDKGYVHYERNHDGRPTGVVSPSGRKFRFKTLGIGSEQILQLENQQELSQERKLLRELQNMRAKNRTNIKEQEP